MDRAVSTDYSHHHRYTNTSLKLFCSPDSVLQMFFYASICLAHYENISLWVWKIKSLIFVKPEISILVKFGVLFGITDFVSAIKGIVL